MLNFQGYAKINLLIIQNITVSTLQVMSVTDQHVNVTKKKKDPRTQKLDAKKHSTKVYTLDMPMAHNA